MEYEQIMTMGNCGSISSSDDPGALLSGKPEPESIPTPDGNGWKLITAVTDVIQYIWQREKN